MLETAFIIKPFVSIIEAESLSRGLNMPVKAIRLWFQNRRAKEKRVRGDIHNVEHTPRMQGQAFPHEPSTVLSMTKSCHRTRNQVHQTNPGNCESVIPPSPNVAPESTQVGEDYKNSNEPYKMKISNVLS